MKILSIETSCDETAAAVVEDGREVLSSVIASQVEEHKLYGGVVPEIASRRHAEAIVPVVKTALSDAKLTIEDIDAIAVTHAPGLIGALLVGVNFAKGLSLSTGKPLIPTHHLRSHIASNYISYKELKPPFMCLVVSGGHSHIVMVEDYTKMKVIGKTRDDAAGEAFDKAARTMGMSYPGGIEMDKIAELGNEKAFEFPRPVVRDAPYDFSFSGLKTSVINLIHNLKQRGEEIPKEDICASFRFAVVDLLVSNFIKAAKDYNVNKLVVAGGVSANSLLRKRLGEEAEKNGFTFFKPDKSVCTDNAAMVGSQAYYEFLSGNIADLSLNAVATLPIDYR
ncbi:MAG: tRNA (adenosine(37)-N6)-threonylcarbamoyltransferase complex transferase subunit TsaD [Ruminococcus sp.]|nr:tRNA (adenosine(37)-N6)-threonylcarbamoyltransferase complex transferase subunit TsaD [Ruminococcus sp.]